MACYAYSVLTRWFSSVYSGAGSRPSLDLMAKQVIASSVTPSEFNDSSQLPDTTYDLPEIVQPTTRKGGDTYKVISLPVETCIFIMGHAHSAFVSTRSIDEMEDALICDGGATSSCTLTKSLENCTLCKPKVAEIQTAHGATIMRKTYLCYKTNLLKTDWEKSDQLLSKHMWCQD